MTDPRAHLVRRWFFIGIFAIAACSGSETDTAANAPAGADAQGTKASAEDGCALLTKSEAQAALGSPIEDFNEESPSPMGTMLRSGCFYEADNGGRLTLTIDTYDTPQTAAQKFQNLKRFYRGAKDVPNVGEAAYADRGNLVVLNGNTQVMVKLEPEGAKKITDYSDATQMDAILVSERGIATQVISRLPAGGVKVASTPTSARSACTIMPKAEMETILGGPLTHAVPTDSPAETACRYTGAAGRFAEVRIEWQGGETGMAAAQMAGAMMGGGAGANNPVKPVDGLGDAAMMMPGGILNVRKGAALISVDLRGRQAGESRAIEIAEKVLARI